MTGNAKDSVASPNTGEPPLLEVRDLVRHYPGKRKHAFGPRMPVRAVDGVSFRIRAGETLALVGESGCGKSTVGRIIQGIDDPSAGQVLFEGRDHAGLDRHERRQRRQDVQLIFQDPLGALDPRLQIGFQIREPLDIHRMGSRAERESRVDWLMESVGLPSEFRRRFPHELSGGQLQRVVIARALALGPRLVVCDEPVSALDVSVQAQVVELLAHIQRRMGVAYLFISHDLKVVRRLAHRVAVMYLGRIVEEGEADEVFRRPRHPYTQALLSAVPIADPALARQRILLTGDPPSPLSPPPGCRFHTRCRHVRQDCTTEIPQLRAVGGGTRAACHPLIAETGAVP